MSNKLPSIKQLVQAVAWNHYIHYMGFSSKIIYLHIRKFLLLNLSPFNLLNVKFSVTALAAWPCNLMHSQFPVLKLSGYMM